REGGRALAGRADRRAPLLPARAGTSRAGTPGADDGAAGARLAGGGAPRPRRRPAGAFDRTHGSRVPARGAVPRALAVAAAPPGTARLRSGGEGSLARRDHGRV